MSHMLSPTVNLKVQFLVAHTITQCVCYIKLIECASIVYRFLSIRKHFVVIYWDLNNLYFK